MRAVSSTISPLLSFACIGDGLRDFIEQTWTALGRTRYLKASSAGPLGIDCATSGSSTRELLAQSNGSERGRIRRPVARARPSARQSARAPRWVGMILVHVSYPRNPRCSSRDVQASPPVRRQRWTDPDVMCLPARRPSERSQHENGARGTTSIWVGCSWICRAPGPALHHD